MSNGHASLLTATHRIISDQIKRPAMEAVLSQLERTLRPGGAGGKPGSIPGDVVEFGCYIGTTSLFIRRMLDHYGSDKQFHVYDSFAGLPPKAAQDNTPAGDAFQAGELSISRKQFIAEFQHAHLRLPVIHKGWFNELTTEDVPDKISFAFLDGDFYESIIDSLRLVWPRLQPGGVLAIDDCNREALPGVDRAIRDFFQDKQITLRVSHNIGIIER
jgi:O-methyltransferase